MKEINEVKSIIKRMNELNRELIDLRNKFYILMTKINKKFKEKVGGKND